MLCYVRSVVWLACVYAGCLPASSTRELFRGPATARLPRCRRPVALVLARLSMASPSKLDSLTSSFNKRREQAWRTHMGTSARVRLSVTARMSSSEADKIKMYSACFHAEGPPPMCADISVMKRFPADRPLSALQDEVGA